MLYVLYTIFFVACIFLVGSVLLQPGKTDAGALFTSNVSNAAFGPRGTASVLSRITIVSASVFMIAAFLISMPALQGNVSVLQSVGETVNESAPATDAMPASDANAAPSTDAPPATNPAPGEANK